MKTLQFWFHQSIGIENLASNTFSDVPTSTSKLNTTSRTDASISPPRSTPPKPLSRVKMKKPTLYEDNLEEFEGEDSEDYTNEAFYNSRKNAPKDSGQNSRTSMTGLDPRRIEQHMKMKRPSSAPMKELAEKENMRPLSTQEIDSSVDLSKHYSYKENSSKSWL